MADRLRAGVIGLGAMGRNHVRVLQNMSDVDLVVVADPAGDQAGSARGVPVVDGVEQVIESGVDLCVVAAPTSHHLRIGRALAQAGIATLVEKPLAADVASADELAAAFADAGVVGCVGHIERFNPAIVAMKHRLSAGELGDIYSVTTRRLGPFPARIADVGVILDLATHDIDLTAWVTGSPFVSISARTAHKSGRTHEDLVSAVGTLANGAVSSHLVNWLTPFKERCTLVTGSRGTFLADTLSADLTFHANGETGTSWAELAQFHGVAQGDRITYAMDKREPLVAELDSFRRAVLGEPAEVVTMADAARTVRVAAAMLSSARTGDTVTLAPGALSSTGS